MQLLALNSLTACGSALVEVGKFFVCNKLCCEYVVRATSGPQFVDCLRQCIRCNKEVLHCWTLCVRVRETLTPAGPQALMPLRVDTRRTPSAFYSARCPPEGA